MNEGDFFDVLRDQKVRIIQFKCGNEVQILKHDRNVDSAVFLSQSPRHPAPLFSKGIIPHLIIMPAGFYCDQTMEETFRK